MLKIVSTWRISWSSTGHWTLPPPVLHSTPPDWSGQQSPPPASAGECAPLGEDTHGPRHRPHSACLTSRRRGTCTPPPSHSVWRPGQSSPPGSWRWRWWSPGLCLAGKNWCWRDHGPPARYTINIYLSGNKPSKKYLQDVSCSVAFIENDQRVELSHGPVLVFGLKQVVLVKTHEDKK